MKHLLTQNNFARTTVAGYKILLDVKEALCSIFVHSDLFTYKQAVDPTVSS